MMELLVISCFVIGYLAIVFEHPIKINKTASALVTGIICWTIIALIGPVSYTSFTDFQLLLPGVEETEAYHHFLTHSLGHHVNEIAQILFFLFGAMTIVELVDVHGGFRVITDRIKLKNPIPLLWLVALLAFILSAILDNLTTTIVMIALLRKIISSVDQRKLFAGIVIIAANAGGAWSPIGDVTTTMLWIGGQISSVNIMKMLFIPSLVCAIVPVLILSFRLKNMKLELFKSSSEVQEGDATNVERSIMFYSGILALIFVPVFKTLTHLPPMMGMMLSLGIVWIISEIVNNHKDEELKKPLSVAHALSKIDSSSILFFLGILLAISALQTIDVLASFSAWMNVTVGNEDVIVFIIGLASAVIDNVPLVAASMGMYDLSQYPMDHKLWEFMAYCSGTGGSILIIGSAAGVAAMGMEKIDFGWYLKKNGFLAFLGYLAGAIVYLVLYSLMYK
ncbi:MAG: sodium:proton antiporter [Chitinophagaceae bacterium]|nr:sodium:proton antiporter [Chitinophagaceae bacterium]